MNRHGEAARRPLNDNSKPTDDPTQHADVAQPRSSAPSAEPAPADTSAGSGGSGSADAAVGQDGDFESPQCRVTLRGPAELADALPYLLGYYPDDSIVLVGLHGPRHRLGGRVRTALPHDVSAWQYTAKELATALVRGSEARGGPPDAVVLYLCQEPFNDEEPRQVMERLRPLAQQVRLACGQLDVPVLEGICVSGGRYWSYCCPPGECCPPEGAPLHRDPASPMAAAATYAGIRVQGSLKELERRLAPLGAPIAERQLRALDLAAAALIPRMLGEDGDVTAVRTETLRLARELLERLRKAEVSEADPVTADARDDALVAPHEAAAMILGLQDRRARDGAAEWTDGPDAQEAARLWRALARRCVRAYTGHAAPPLTLAGWASWSAGDGTQARVAFAAALEADPSYVLARLLHEAVNGGMDPELVRRCMRGQLPAPAS